MAEQRAGRRPPLRPWRAAGLAASVAVWAAFVWPAAAEEGENPCECGNYCAGMAQAAHIPLPPPPAMPMGPLPQGRPPPARSVRPNGHRVRRGAASLLERSGEESGGAPEAQVEGPWVPDAPSAQSLLARGRAARTALEEAERRGPWSQEPPGMYCNCHCPLDPYVWMRTSKPTIDWTATPPPPPPTPPGAPCSGTNEEWPNCPANMNEGGPVKGAGSLKGLPVLPKVGAGDLMPPQAHLVPTDPPEATIPGAPPEPIRPVEEGPPPPAGEEAPAEDPGPGAPAGNCVDSHLQRIPCPKDPELEKGWWGPALDPADIYYVSEGSYTKYR